MFSASENPDEPLQIAWSQLSTQHFVQLYDCEDELISSVASYVTDGLRSGDGAIVVTDRRKRTRLEAAAHSSGFHTTEWGDRFQAIDRTELLSAFMDGTAPSSDKFFAALDPVIEKARHDTNLVRIYGDMVAELWDARNRRGAAALEKLWNDYGKVRKFSLYCAYPRRAWENGHSCRDFCDVCDAHSLILI